jgi:hypothetical protein
VDRAQIRDGWSWARVGGDCRHLGHGARDDDMPGTMTLGTSQNERMRMI